MKPSVRILSLCLAFIRVGLLGLADGYVAMMKAKFPNTISR